MKKIISLALLGATTSLFALYAEHASLYKDPRIMGMGGANVAVGGYSTSVFSNPAGLTNIKKEHGYVVDLLSLGASFSSDGMDFIDDVNDVETSDINPNATTDMINVLRKYSGENFHVRADNYTAISKNSDAFAWSVGILAATESNFMAHPNGGSQGLLSTSTRVYGGVVLGAAKPYDLSIGRLDVGMSVKYIKLESYEGSLSVNDLIGNEDVDDLIERKYKKENSGVGVDIGVTYRPFVDSFWNPSFGLSVLNIGSMDMDDYYGGQPMTVNIGAAVSPKIDIFDKLVIAVDYVDLLDENKLRLYDLSNDTVVTYKDYDESDFEKRLRLGVSLGLIDTTFLSTTLNVGLYQGAYTAGIDFHIAVVRLNFATYEEQVGTGDIDISDRRYMGQLAISW
ncbi:conjugal transfer protein TraF [Sulfurimonas lithotrophica]|uniref:Conjugal transfer protein TraF n=1 Tax=Sulfurimonas lithotrophica TaxID=2590022 RepID=A0A5P8NXV2_9BACT|nr:conjugal transfer protein TraF [Sulfurimonas lithotrophica]QFR48248.1 conjugal transfer protein TraF [Sulfurimonas lithotrophica]